MGEKYHITIYDHDGKTRVIISQETTVLYNGEFNFNCTTMDIKFGSVNLEMDGDWVRKLSVSNAYNMGNGWTES